MGILPMGKAGQAAKVGEELATTIARRAEHFNWPVRTEYGKVVDMPITINPRASHIQRMLKDAPFGDIRALRAPSGDMYVWPANEAMHVDIASNFSLPFKNRAELQKNSFLFNKSEIEKVGRFSDFDDLIKKIESLAE